MLRSMPVLLAAGLAAASGAALANDSSAELAAGGLIFVRNENVEMRSEDLTISAKEIVVRYRFFNKSAKDVTVLVAFPMPEIHIDAIDQNISIPTEDPVNFLAFRTTVNGQPVIAKVEQRVMAAGLDRTELLRGLNIPLAPHLRQTREALDKLPRARWDDLIRFGLVEVEVFDACRSISRRAGRCRPRSTGSRRSRLALRPRSHTATSRASADRCRPRSGSPRRSMRTGTRSTGTSTASSRISTTQWSARGAKPTARSARRSASSASNTSSRPVPTGRARSSSSASSWTRAARTVS